MVQLLIGDDRGYLLVGPDEQVISVTLGKFDPETWALERAFLQYYPNSTLDLGYFREICVEQVDGFDIVTYSCRAEFNDNALWKSGDFLLRNNTSKLLKPLRILGYTA